MTQHRLVRRITALSPRTRRIAAYALGTAILLGGGLGIVLGGHPHDQTTTATRSDDRASRGEVRSDIGLASASPSATPSGTPSVSPTPTTAPTSTAPAVKPTTPRATRTTATAPKVTAAGCDAYSGNRLVACNLLPSFGFATSEMAALDQMWEHESGWSTSAANPSGAYGIPQALPGSKMATAGSDWRTNPATQISWGLSYIKGRYGSPSSAWSYWQSHGWY